MDSTAVLAAAVVAVPVAMWAMKARQRPETEAERLKRRRGWSEDPETAVLVDRQVLDYAKQKPDFWRAAAMDRRKHALADTAGTSVGYAAREVPGVASAVLRKRAPGALVTKFAGGAAGALAKAGTPAFLDWVGEAELSELERARRKNLAEAEAETGMKLGKFVASNEKIDTWLEGKRGDIHRFFDSATERARTSDSNVARFWGNVGKTFTDLPAGIASLPFTAAELANDQVENNMLHLLNGRTRVADLKQSAAYSVGNAPGTIGGLVSQGERALGNWLGVDWLRRA